MRCIFFCIFFFDRVNKSFGQLDLLCLGHFFIIITKNKEEKKKGYYEEQGGARNLKFEEKNILRCKNHFNYFT